MRVPVGEYFAIIDPEDWDVVAKYSWHPVVDDDSRTIYALTAVFSDGKRSNVRMHTMITGFKMVDHVNRNGLDNRKENLRPSSRMQNAQNQQKRRKDRRGLTSKYKGVSLVKGYDRWRAVASLNRKRVHLGYFTTEVEAAQAYDTFARKNFGEFACLNFPEV